MPGTAGDVPTDQQRECFERFVSTGGTRDRTHVVQVLELQVPRERPLYIRQVLRARIESDGSAVDVELTGSAFDATIKQDFAPGLWDRLIAGEQDLVVRSIGIYQLMRVM